MEIKKNDELDLVIEELLKKPDFKFLYPEIEYLKKQMKVIELEDMETLCYPHED